ncbi:uncharacterized protein [Henckelia pumila]|uniref:uncharacterized protein n=1 Tax=Henckelia pumila TaxID=405737 RepID=UPI003C6EA08B
MKTKNGAVFFINGPGGTGKTFLYRALLATIRSQGLIALATATSGVAASIFPGGRTAHSRFKIPIDLHANSYCSISKQGVLAQLLRHANSLLSRLWTALCRTLLEQTIDGCLIRSHSYRCMEIIVLSENMRARSDPLFCEFLRGVGRGIEQTDDNGNI